MAENKLTKVQQSEIHALDLKLDQVSRGYSILNENQVQKLFNSTPAKWKYKRPGKGGGEWTYVKKGYVRKTLDAVFGFDWDFTPETSVGEAFEVAKMTGTCVVKGKLTMRVRENKTGALIATLEKGEYGRSEVKFQTETVGGKKQRKMDEFTGAPVPLDFGNDMKAASTDCVKRCAALMGIAADVYEPEEFFQINIVGADQTSEKAKHVEDMVAEAKKKVLRTQSNKVGEQNAAH